MRQACSTLAIDRCCIRACMLLASSLLLHLSRACLDQAPNTCQNKPP